MHNDIILEKIIQMFSAMTEAENITPESELMEDLAISSMDILYLVSCLEEEFGIKIPESKVRRMFTIDDVAKVVCDLKNKQKKK